MASWRLFRNAAAFGGLRCVPLPGVYPMHVYESAEPRTPLRGFLLWHGAAGRRLSAEVKRRAKNASFS